MKRQKEEKKERKKREHRTQDTGQVDKKKKKKKKKALFVSVMVVQRGRFSLSRFSFLCVPVSPVLPCPVLPCSLVDVHSPQSITHPFFFPSPAFILLCSPLSLSFALFLLSCAQFCLCGLNGLGPLTAFALFSWPCFFALFPWLTLFLSGRLC